MKRLLQKAARAVLSLAAGESGWISLSGSNPLTSYGLSTPSGQTVSAETAMKVSAVWSCVSKTAQLVGTLPLTLYERTENGGRRRIENDLADIVTRSPNRDATAVEFWEGNVAHQVLRGNAFSEKMTIGRDRLVGLRPLLNCTPRLKNGRWEFHVVDRGKVEVLPPEKVLHLRGFGAGDGLGLSAIKYGANSMGAALAADETAASVFSNRMMAGGVVSSEQTLNAEQRTSIGEMLGAFVGSNRAGKMLILEAGLTYQQLQMNPEDAQLLDTRRFSVEDVCRWFGVPPIVIGHSPNGQTMWGTGVEAIMLAWLTNGINPLVTRMEARMNKDLIPVEQRRRWFFQFDREAMLRMDSRAKGDFMLKMRMGGFMSGDEGRDLLGLERRGGADDELFIQSALEPTRLLTRETENG